MKKAGLAKKVGRKPAQVDAVKRTAEAYLAGVPLQKIMKAEKVTRQAIFLRLAKAGVKAHNAHNYSEAAIQKAVALYVKGHSAQKVADKTGCSTATVHGWLKAAGVKARPAAAYRDEAMLQRTADLYLKGGLSTNAIARKEGIAQSAVVSRLQRAGVKLRPRSGFGPKAVPVEAPVVEAPVVKAPVVEAPVVGAPVVETVETIAEPIPVPTQVLVEAAVFSEAPTSPGAVVPPAAPALEAVLAPTEATPAPEVVPETTQITT